MSNIFDIIQCLKDFDRVTTEILFGRCHLTSDKLSVLSMNNDSICRLNKKNPLVKNYNHQYLILNYNDYNSFEEMLSTLAKILLIESELHYNENYDDNDYISLKMSKIKIILDKYIKS